MQSLFGYNMLQFSGRKQDRTKQELHKPLGTDLERARSWRHSEAQRLQRDLLLFSAHRISSLDCSGERLGAGVELSIAACRLFWA